MPAPCHTLAALFVKEDQNEKHNHSEKENKLVEKGPFLHQQAHIQFPEQTQCSLNLMPPIPAPGEWNSPSSLEALGGTGHCCPF